MKNKASKRSAKELSSENHWTADFQGKAKICTSYFCTSAYLLASVCATDGDGTRSYSALLLTAFDISNLCELKELCFYDHTSSLPLFYLTETGDLSKASDKYLEWVKRAAGNFDVCLLYFITTF